MGPRGPGRPPHGRFDRFDTGKIEFSCDVDLAHELTTPMARGWHITDRYRPLQGYECAMGHTLCAGFTAFYSALGSQPGCTDPNAGADFTAQDAVGFAGQWGCYTEQETWAQSAGYPTVRDPIVLIGLRYYDPSVGRFINRDPIDYGGGVSLYAYLHDNPINGAHPMRTQGSMLRRIIRKRTLDAVQ